MSCYGVKGIIPLPAEHLKTNRRVNLREWASQQLVGADLPPAANFRECGQPTEERKNADFWNSSLTYSARFHLYRSFAVDMGRGELEFSPEKKAPWYVIFPK